MKETEKQDKNRRITQTKDIKQGNKDNKQEYNKRRKIWKIIMKEREKKNKGITK